MNIYETMMQIEILLEEYWNEVSQNKTFSQIQKLYPRITLDGTIDDAENILSDLCKFIRIAELVEKYKDNSDYMTEKESVAKITSLLSLVDATASIDAIDGAKMQKIKDEQNVIRNELLELGFKKIGLFENNQIIKKNTNGMVSISDGHPYTEGLKLDRTVVAVGDNGFNQCDVKGLEDVVAISAGTFHTVGLRTDGTVVAVGWNDDGQCNVKGWENIIAISTGCFHTVGLRSDGTVVAVGGNGFNQCNVEGWKDIVTISAGDSHTVALKSDGTVVAVGTDNYGQCGVEGWKDIVAISAGRGHTVALK